MLSPRQVAASDRDATAGPSGGVKRRLDEELHLHQTITSSLKSRQVATRNVAGCDRQQQQLSSVFGDVNRTIKRIKGSSGAEVRRVHSSAFDLVDDALHISSDDECEMPSLSQ